MDTLPDEGVCPFDHLGQDYAMHVVARYTDEDTGNILTDMACDFGHTWTQVSRLQQIMMMGHRPNWRFSSAPTGRAGELAPYRRLITQFEGRTIIDAALRPGPGREGLSWRRLRR